MIIFIRLLYNIMFPWCVCVCVACLAVIVCVVWSVLCVSWVLSPALQPCDLCVQMRRPIDHKIGVPFCLWQPNCRWRLTSHYLPSLPPYDCLFFPPLSPSFCPPSLLAISASVNESSTSGTN